MFASRTNQENAVYQQQQATAAKNQGVNNLAPKTPGFKAPKTPFKIPLNDENATFGAGKTGGKGKDGLFGDGKGGKVDPSAFVTPAGPRNRAPLGNKTTNAKGNGLRTPAARPLQEQPSAKPTSPRMRRSKVKVLQSEPETLAPEAEREIEYMPPREIPLPDHPDDYSLDQSFPQFQGKNFTRGWYSESAHKQNDDDDSDMSDLDEKIRKMEKDQAEKKAKQHAVVRSKPVPTKRDPLTNKAPSTLAARKASSALGSRSSGAPSFAAPTAATKAKVPGILSSRKPILGSTSTGNARHAAARAASKTTLGYARGRAVSGAARRLDDIHRKPENKSSLPFGDGNTSLDQLLGLSLEDDREDDDLCGGVEDHRGGEDDALDEFQLEVPE